MSVCVGAAVPLSNRPDLEEEGDWTKDLETEGQVTLDSTGLFHWCSPVYLDEVTLVRLGHWDAHTHTLTCTHTHTHSHTDLRVCVSCRPPDQRDGQWPGLPEARGSLCVWGPGLQASGPAGLHEDRKSVV